MDHLAGLYAAIGARDGDALAALLAPDVDWPEAVTGGRVVGRDAVRAYWARQWVELRFSLHPRLMRERPDGRVEVLVDQVVQDADGDLLSESVVLHLLTLTDGLVPRLVTRLDVADPGL